MAIVHAHPIELALVNRTQRLDIEIVDDSDPPVPVDATELTFELRDLCDTVLYSEDFFAAPSRIQHPSTGRYYFTLGDTPIVPPATTNPETGTRRDLVGVWHVVGPTGSEADDVVQTVKIVSARTMRLVSYFQRFIDKALKYVDPKDPLNPCNVGYTDADLIVCLEGGLQTINAYQPYPMWCSLDDFPDIHRQTLIEAGLVAGVIMQQIFSIDTDVPNWSDQGNAFVILHQAPLANLMNQLSQRLDAMITKMKLHYVKSGALHVEMGPNYRLQTLISAAPYGASFRNIAFVGM